MCMLILGVPAVAQHQPTITTIDAPGAGATSGYGTEGIAMNQAGVVTGCYVGYGKSPEIGATNRRGKD